MAATGGASLFDAASGPFKFQIGTLMWPCGTLKVCLFWLIECGDGLSECE